MGNDTESQPDNNSASAPAATEAVPGGVVVVQDPDSDIPDGGYGWVCVACVFFINACTWGIAAVKPHYTPPQHSPQFPPPPTR